MPGTVGVVISGLNRDAVCCDEGGMLVSHPTQEQDSNQNSWQENIAWDRNPGLQPDDGQPAGLYWYTGGWDMWDRYWNIRDNLSEYGTDLELGDSNDWDGSLRGCGGSDDLTYIYTGIIRPWYETPDATNQDGDGPVNMYPFCNEDRNNGDMNAQEVDYNGDGNIDSDECSIDLRDYIQITVNGAQIDPADIELSLSPPHFGCGGNPDCGVDGKIFIMTFTVAADVPDSATAQCQVQGNEKVA